MFEPFHHQGAKMTKQVLANLRIKDSEKKIMTKISLAYDIKGKIYPKVYRSSFA